MTIYGINIKIDVTKIDEGRLFKGKKGTYLDLTAFFDPDNPGKYDDHGTVTQAQTQEDRNNGEKMPIIGNVRKFYEGESKAKQKKGGGFNPPVASEPKQIPDEDIPF